MISFFDRLEKSSKYILIQSVILFVLLNLFLSDWNCRKDLSREKRFDLTESTEKIISNLPEKLYIDAFYSNDVPGAHQARLNLAKEILKEIASVNRKKVELRFYDPDSNESAKKKASEAGIRPLELQKRERGAAEVKSAYFGFKLTIGSKSETVPVAYQAEAIEFEVLRLLKKMTRKGNSSSLGIISANGALAWPDPNQGGLRPDKDTFSAVIHQALAPDSGLPGSVEINKGTVPEEFTTLLWAGAPELTEEGKYNIDQFLMRGGNLLILAKTMEFQIQNRRQPAMMMGGQQGLASAHPEAAKLKAFTENYGFEVRSEMILEPESSQVTDTMIDMESGTLNFDHYPLWPIAVMEKGGLSEKSGFTKNSSAVLLPWVSGIDIKKEKQPDAAYNVIIQSTRDADRRADYLTVGENQAAKMQIKPNGNNIPLGVHIEGVLKSAFRKENIPASANASLFKEKTDQGKKSQIVVIGTPYLISDILLKRETQDTFVKTNIPFFLNLVDILSGDTDLLAARSRSSYIQNIKPVTKFSQFVYSFINILLIPILAGIYAFWRIKKRNKGEKA